MVGHWSDVVGRKTVKITHGEVRYDKSYRRRQNVSKSEHRNENRMFTSFFETIGGGHTVGRFD